MKTAKNQKSLFLELPAGDRNPLDALFVESEGFLQRKVKTPYLAYFEAFITRKGIDKSL